MNTDQLKQRIASRFHEETGTFKYDFGPIPDLLRDCLKHIEQLEAACAFKTDLLRAVRYSMDREVPFPSLAKITEAINDDSGKALLDRLKDAEFKLKTYAMFRLRCDKCGDLFNDHHQGDSCPGAFYKNCEGTLQFNLPEAVSDRLQAVEAERDELKRLIDNARKYFPEMLGVKALQPPQKEQQ